MVVMMMIHHADQMMNNMLVNNTRKRKNDADSETFEMEQQLMAKLIQLIYNEDTDVHFETLHLARKYFGKGGDHRLVYTFPALVFNALGLIQRTQQKLTNPSEDSNSSTPSMKPKKNVSICAQDMPYLW